MAVASGDRVSWPYSMVKMRYAGFGEGLDGSRFWGLNRWSGIRGVIALFGFSNECR